MAICTSKSASAISTTLPKLPTLTASSSATAGLSRLRFSRSRRATTLLRCTQRTSTSEEARIEEKPYVVEEANGFGGSSVEEKSPAVDDVVGYSENAASEQSGEGAGFPETINELLSDLNLKFDSEDTVSLVIYGSGALLAIWLLSAVVNAVDSIPLFPKLMEVVGLGYSAWFTTRYLLFKKNREELGEKVAELKQQVLGTRDE
ncbi:Protein CURVATURE THYLAKOID 1D, chloroplastic [Linum perenne]